MPPLQFRAVLIAPRGARVDVAELCALLGDRPVAERALLRQAAATLGGQAVDLVEQLLLGGPLADVRRYLRYLAPVLRRSMHLVAAYVGGGRPAIEDVVAERDGLRLLAPRGLRAWLHTSRQQRVAFAAREPGGAALVGALNELATGRSGVTTTEYQSTLRFLLLALIHGGLSGLGLTLRVMAHLGEVHLRIGRLPVASRGPTPAAPRVCRDGASAVESALPGPLGTGAPAALPPGPVTEHDHAREQPFAGRLLPLSAERTSIAACPPTGPTSANLGVSLRAPGARPAVTNPPPGAALREAEAAEVLLTLQTYRETRARTDVAWDLQQASANPSFAAGNAPSPRGARQSPASRRTNAASSSTVTPSS